MKKQLHLSQNSKVTLSLIVITLIGISLIILRKEYDRFQSTGASANFSIQEINDISTAAPNIQSFAYDLLNGWNFIAFPTQPINIKTASQLIKEASNAGGAISTVARWNGDRWQEFTQRDIQQYGTDFAIEAGEAYFIRSHAKVRLDILIDTNQPQPQKITLESGWNALGISWEKTDAKNVADQINQPKVEIDWWNSGSWEVYVKQNSAITNQKEFGVNFPINSMQGYMVKVESPVTLERTR